MAQREPELPEGTDQVIEAPDAPKGVVVAPESGSALAGLKSQLKDTSVSLRAQATDKARSYAVEGKDRATTALDDIAKAITDAAGSVDERLGAEYGDYARRAADALQGFSENLRNKEVDDLYEEAAELVRKSPAAAVGIAAAIGFALVRVVKAGAPEPTGAKKGGKRSSGTDA